MVRRSQAGREEGGDLTTILQIALLFFALLVGREIGDIYSTHREVSQLYVVFEVEEEELAGFVREVLAGHDADLEVGLAFTLPKGRVSEGPVTQVPDYVRRWFISVTLSAIVVRQPEVSEVEVQLQVEGEPLMTETFPFRREKVPYLRLLRRTIAVRIEDTERFRRIIQEASERYGGEVEFRFTGRSLAHVFFLKAWLPFSTTRYPLVRAPHVEYRSSKWVDADGRPLQRTSKGGPIYVSVDLRNPTRVHSNWENVTIAIYRVGVDEPVYTAWKEVGVAPGTTATYVFPFTPEEPDTYFYVLETPGGFRLDGTQSPSLKVEPG